MPPAINRSMTATEWGLLLLLCIVWGGSYFYIGVAIKALPPFAIVAFRVTVGAAILYGIVRISGRRLPTDSATWRAFFVMGLANNVIPFSLIAWAQGHVPSGFAAILNATTPIFAVILANAMTADEKMTSGRLAGVIIGFAGVAVMIGPDALTGATDNLLADLALLTASVFYAFSPIYGRRFSRQGLPPMVAAAGQFTAAGAMMLPLTLIVDAPWTLPLGPDMAAKEGLARNQYKLLLPGAGADAQVVTHRRCGFVEHLRECIALCGFYGFGELERRPAVVDRVAAHLLPF